MKTFTDNVECPQGHQFTVRRLLASAGYVVETMCKECERRFHWSVPNVAAAARRKLNERDIEARLVRDVKKLGGEVRKVRWEGRSGAPDRLVMLPPTNNPEHDNPWQGRTIWVELKAPGGAAKFPRNAHERAQQREHERMRRMGQRVEVVDSYQQIEELLK